VLCPSCRCQVARGAGFCGACGTPVGNGRSHQPLQLVLPDGAHVVLAETLTIGRTPANSVQLADSTVSRAHARIVVASGGVATLEDVGSSHGTFLDGTKVSGPAALRPGAKIRLGDTELRVESAPDEAAAGRTIVVPAGASLAVSAVGAAQAVAPAVAAGRRPKAKSGWALKRLDAAEGERRFVLRDLRGGDFVRLSAVDAGLFELLDGTRTLPELIAEAEQREGPVGPGRLARLLADLGDRGLLEGAEGRARDEGPKGRFARMMQPKEWSSKRLGAWFTKAYRGGGWVLFTRPVLALIAALVVAGIGAFVYLIAKRYGTPFVVASKIGLGGLVFLLGRFAVVAVHEAAHGLTMASFGRKVEKAGLKFIIIFPYAFVDTSQAWFESRGRRIAVSAAGPVSDLALGGLASLACLAAPKGTIRDIFFQLAFAAYVGAFFNLNPFLDRDGYQMLVDWLREPGLRRRSREQFQRKLSGGPAREGDSPVLARYAMFGLVWGVLAALFAIGFSTRYYSTLEALAPKGLVYAALGSLYVMLFIPVIWQLARPLSKRSARLPTEVKRVRL
jgi:putative peptide zinc metalloprotease protein